MKAEAEEKKAKSQYEMDLKIRELKIEEAKAEAAAREEARAKAQNELNIRMEKEALDRLAMNKNADGNEWTASMPESALSRTGHAPLKWANAAISQDIRNGSSSSSSSDSESD